jgi:Protein of unknown function (DUF2726)
MSNLALQFGGQKIELVIIIIALVIAAALLVFDRFWKPQRRRFRPFYRRRTFDAPQGPDLTDAVEQLRAVMAGSFEKQKVMSFSEYRLFAIVETEIATQRPGYRVFAQTSLGEVLKSSDNDAFRSINSKRVDILVIDHSGWPILAVEYQGNGHYQGTAAARDAVKKDALRKAGVRYLEFCETDTDEQVRLRIREHFGGKAGASPKH